MKKFWIGLAILAGTGLLGALMVGSYIVGTYNGFIASNQNVTTSWAQVETQYQRRYDLIPNLVGATKGAMQQERAVFSAIANARARYAGSGSGTADKMQAANAMDSAISRLLVVMENYPQLKSNETIQNLMDELAGTENRINVARFRYNESAQAFNTAIGVFPGKLIASFFNFTAHPYFEAQNPAKTAPKVDLSRLK